MVKILKHCQPKGAGTDRLNLNYSCHCSTRRLRTGITVRTKLTSLTLRAKENPKCKFVSLAHLLTEDFLIDCFGELKRDKASGIDKVSVDEYGKNLEENIRDLVERLKKKSYRPKPARRIYIPKASGSMRLIIHLGY